MAGIYIPMEMPINCRKCAFRFLRLCVVTEKQLKESEMLHIDEDCPLVPVPDRRRCVDADAFWGEINKICDRRDAGIISDFTCLNQILSAIRHAPTIFPADEESTE